MIAEQTDIPAQNTMVTASHTHNSPDTMSDTDEMDKAWMDELAGKLTSCVVQARNSLEPAKVGVGIGELDINVNRRGGTALDRSLNIVKVEGFDEKLIAVVVNYTAHPVSAMDTDLAISADFPGYAMKALEKETGAIRLFTNGALGNVNPIRDFGHGWSAAEKLGLKLAQNTLDLLPSITCKSSLELSTERKVAEFPLRDFSELKAERKPPESYANVMKSFREGPKLAWSRMSSEQHTAMREERIAILLDTFGDQKEIISEIQGFRLGDAVLVGVGGEVYVEYQLKIKSAFPELKVIVMGLANDEIGYVPTPEAFEKGWYEASPSWWFSKVSPECGKVMTEYAIALIRSLLSYQGE